MRLASARDDWRDPECSQEPAVLVVVIAPVSENAIRLAPGTADLPRDRAPVQRFDQRQQLRDVVAVPAGQSDRERDPARVDQQMVL